MISQECFNNFLSKHALFLHFRTTTCVHLIPTRKPFGNPKFVLLHVLWYRVSPKAKTYNSPCDSSNWAKEEEVIYGLIFIAEVACWISNPW